MGEVWLLLRNVTVTCLCSSLDWRPRCLRFGADGCVMVVGVGDWRGVLCGWGFVSLTAGSSYLNGGVLILDG